jgi:hypothetical protein
MIRISKKNYAKTIKKQIIYWVLENNIYVSLYILFAQRIIYNVF